jgi:hypothetical protein
MTIIGYKTFRLVIEPNGRVEIYDRFTTFICAVESLEEARKLIDDADFAIQVRRKFQ